MNLAQSKREYTEKSLSVFSKYLSIHTGFIHYCYEDERSRDTIPVFENLCYCLSLFRTSLVDNILLGREILAQIMRYQDADGNFPIYLHQFPKTFNVNRVMYPLYLLVKHFSKIIPQKLFDQLNHRLVLPQIPQSISNSRDAGYVALNYLCRDQSIQALKHLWDYDKNIYCGPLGNERQRGLDLDVTLFDIIMGQLEEKKCEHPIFMHASLLFDTENSALPAEDIPPLCRPKPAGKGFHLFRKSWRDSCQIHTLVCQDKHLTYEDGQFFYPEQIIDDKVQSELNLYTEKSSEKNILVNGDRSTVFQLGDEITIVTKTRKFICSFSLVNGEGEFIGRVSFGNRPSQVLPSATTGFDWRISLRTLRRKGPVTILLKMSG